jgi:hypothetical protein
VVSLVREKRGEITMKIRILAALPLLAAFAFTQQAKADVKVDFSFSGDGVSASGVLTYDPTLIDPISGGAAITGISGIFSDSNIGISDATITGLFPSTGNAGPAGTSPFPTAMSYYFVSNGVFPPGQPEQPFLSYDNLFYANGSSPVVCTDYNGAGGFLDTYGLVFTTTATKGDGPIAVDLFSNGYNSGFIPPGVGIYGVGVADPVNSYDYVSFGVNLAVPEPSTWAMMALGFAGLGFAGYRRTRKETPAVA